MNLLSRRIEDMKRVVSQYPMAGLKVDNLVLAVRAERDAEIIVLLEEEKKQLLNISGLIDSARIVAINAHIALIKGEEA